VCYILTGMSNGTDVLWFCGGGECGVGGVFGGGGAWRWSGLESCRLGFSYSVYIDYVVFKYLVKPVTTLPNLFLSILILFTHVAYIIECKFLSTFPGSASLPAHCAIHRHL